LDFGLIVDGAVIISENALRRLAERQRALARLLTLPERLQETMGASKEMIQPTVFGQIIIITVYLPQLTFTRIEGKMFEPMALTVISALVTAFILSLTFVPAMLVTGPAQETENLPSAPTSAAMSRFCLVRYEIRPLSSGPPWHFSCFSLFLFTRLGQEFIPTLDEGDLAMHAMRIPSTALSQSTSMQLQVERALRALPEVAFVFSKTGTADIASDPMPPHVSDTFIILKP